MKRTASYEEYVALPPQGFPMLVEVAGRVVEEKPDLQSLLAEWQKVLRLRDWDVKLVVVRQTEIPGDQGQCRWRLAKKAAVILLLDPIDYPTDSQWAQDMEKTLVHELIHLHLAAIDNFEGLEGKVLEQAVECMATALITLKRAK